MKELVEEEEEILSYKGKTLPDDLLVRAKKTVSPTNTLPNFSVCPKRDPHQTSGRCGRGLGAAPVSGVENARYYYSTYSGKI